MASHKNNELEEAMQETLGKIQQKQYAYNLAETEYIKLLDQSEKYTKTIDAIRKKKLQCENILKARLSRMYEVEKTEKDFEKEIIKNKKLISDFNLNLLNVEKEKLEVDKLFSQEVKQLVEKLCDEREVFCKNALSEELQSSYDENNAYDQEIRDLRQIISEITSQYPIFKTSHEQAIESTRSQLPFIKVESERERLGNIRFEKKKLIYEQRKISVLNEIQKMEEQL